jgi:hypothetical protein
VTVLSRLVRALEDNARAVVEDTKARSANTAATLALKDEVSKLASAVEQLVGAPGEPAFAEIKVGQRVPE